MQHKIQLSVGSQNKILSKEQKKFNDLLDKIKKIKRDIVAMRGINADFHKKADAVIAPAQKLYLDANQKMVLSLENAIAIHKLPKRPYKKFCSIMQLELESILSQADAGDVTIFKDLYQKYAKMSYEDRQKQMISEVNDMTGGMFESMFGFDLNDLADNMNDPEKMQAFMAEKMREQHEAAHAQQQARAEKQAAKPKTAAQLKKEAAEKEMSKTTKQIYMDLVKNFHPDQEQDEKEIARKTAIMQEVVAAYQEDNFIKLLELQMSLLENRENSFSRLDDKQLKHFTKVLQEQLRTLRDEYERVSPNPANNPYYELFAEQEWVRKMKLERAVSDLGEQTTLFLNTIDIIQTFDGFKQFVREFELPKDEMEGMNLLDFLI
ncbi:MAG: hypothetical protein RLZZ628_4023 [Bacteroidota bacterium]|jgi:chemotaxis protein histidine kinase CheA